MLGFSGSPVAPVLGSTIGGAGILAILTVTLMITVVFYHHHRKVKYRSQLHEPYCESVKITVVILNSRTHLNRSPGYIIKYDST